MKRAAWGMPVPRMKAWLRVIVHLALLLAVLVPLVSASGLSGYVRALGGGSVHRCHCQMAGPDSTCSCPLCHPFDPAYRTSHEAFRGQCGDDYDDSTRGIASPSVPAMAASLRLRVPERVAVVVAERLAPEDPGTQPPVPPPRTRFV